MTSQVFPEQPALRQVNTNIPNRHLCKTRRLQGSGLHTRSLQASAFFTYGLFLYGVAGEMAPVMGNGLFQRTGLCLRLGTEEPDRLREFEQLDPAYTACTECRINRCGVTVNSHSVTL